MNNHRSSYELGLEGLRPALRAALYMRVSTGRQAEHDLSIPDQRSQLKSWCRANAHTVVAGMSRQVHLPSMIAGRPSSK
jgi:hypothetical protein